MALTVIEHGYVIPVSTNQVIEDGVVAFEDARIVYVGPSDKFDRRKFTPTSTINARGKAILPGLVNTHTHLVGAYMKALTEDVPARVILPAFTNSDFRS
jgi:5-methylthioadenosine/S-adenosylhomocysteine deaminase